MAQSGYTPILIYASGTAAALPSAANLTSSANGAELALNYADGKLYYKNSSGVVTLLANAATAAGSPPGGSNTQVQYNNSGAFGGSANFVWDNSNVRLGIGTSSPSTSLHVVGSSSAITATVSSTSTTINGAPSLKVINTGSSTTNQLAEIQFRYEDGTYNANGAIAALRESGTARGQSFIFAPSDSLGNPTERMRIDSSGNVGIGVTPSAWGSFAKALQIGSRTAVYQDTNDAIFSNNAYGATGGNTYIATAAATQYYQSAGTHVWRTAPSGTAGTTITFTERMRIDSSGNVGIGTSSPANPTGGRGLEVSNSTGASVRVTSSATFLDMQAGTSATYFVSNGAYPLIFNVNGSERVRIESAGQIGIGGANYGSAGQVLTSNGSSSAPSWQAAAGGTSLLFCAASAPLFT